MGIQLPPAIASCLTVAFIIYLFRRDIRERPNVSGALWLPLIWLVICCSRGLSLWLDIFGVPVSGGASVEEGSPLDAAFFSILIAAGLYVLTNRGLRLSEIVRNNQWLTIFLLYCLVSVIWSDFPFVAFKRWIKILGHPIMALIVLTEPDLKEALTRLMKRCAYVVVPVSMLFIKFYPQLGRAFEPWSGMATSTGITTNKNMLGADCLILGFFFFWHLLQTRRAERSTWRRNELWLSAGFSIGICWLFSQAHSATALTSLLLGILVILFVGLRSINKNFIGTYLLAALLLVAVAELVFGISGRFSEALGRGSELSGRTLLWTRLLNMDTNPILGTGFESFWLGERPERLKGLFYFIPNEAHNGYLETYLTLGVIGVFLLVGLFISTFWKTRLELFQNFEWGRYRLGFLVAVILYNWTEAAFKTVNPIWFVFYLIAIDYPGTQLTTSQAPVAFARSEEDMEFAYIEENTGR
ncbi:MAG TPA: O-antigen ligase family protein [Candidatus Udaeobacter sp.]|jgi:O-antigen ligase